MNSLINGSLILIVITTTFFAGDPMFAQQNQSATVVDHSVDQLKWMAGSWVREIRLDEKIMSTVEEQWMKPKGEMMLGVNRTVYSEGKTAFEFMRIAKTEKGIIFFASPDGKPAIGFTLTDLTGERVIFENSDHDFPQRVIYRRDGDQLIGRIEGLIDGQEKSVEWKYFAAE